MYKINVLFVSYCDRVSIAVQVGIRRGLSDERVFVFDWQWWKAERTCLFNLWRPNETVTISEDEWRMRVRQAVSGFTDFTDQRRIQQRTEDADGPDRLMKIFFNQFRVLLTTDFTHLIMYFMSAE